MNLAWLNRGAASAERSRRLMEMRGVTPNGHPLWQGWEVSPVVEMYPRYGSIFPALPRRTKPAVYGKASRLGITKGKAREWDVNEIPRLRRVYPTGTRAEIEAAFPGRSYSACSKAANARGIYRAPRPYKATGILLIDQILLRARAKNWALSDLDKEIRVPGYFSNRKWKRHLNPSAHFRAVSLLGGVVRARFPAPHQNTLVDQ